MSSSIDDAATKIENLKGEAFREKEERDRLNSTVKKMAEERAENLQKFHDLIAKGKEEKAKRDELRGQLAQQKSGLDALYKELEEKKEEVSKLMQKTGNVRSGRSRASMETKLRELEWKYQTSILTAEQERAYVKSIDELTKRLNVLRKADEERNKVIEQNAAVEDIRKRISTLRDQMNGLRTEINEHHNGMSTFFTDATEIRKKIEELSAKIEEIKEQATQHHTRYIQLLSETRPFSDSIQQQIRAEREARNKKMVEKQKLLTQEALSKYNNGKKLTLEEFQLLVENGYL